MNTSGKKAKKKNHKRYMREILALALLCYVVLLCTERP